MACDLRCMLAATPVASRVHACSVFAWPRDCVMGADPRSSSCNSIRWRSRASPRSQRPKHDLLLVQSHQEPNEVMHSSSNRQLLHPSLSVNVNSHHHSRNTCQQIHVHILSGMHVKPPSLLLVPSCSHGPHPLLTPFPSAPPLSAAVQILHCPHVLLNPAAWMTGLPLQRQDGLRRSSSPSSCGRMVWDHVGRL